MHLPKQKAMHQEWCMDLALKYVYGSKYSQNSDDVMEKLYHAMSA